jgi:hypothetical protein
MILLFCCIKIMPELSKLYCQRTLLIKF